MKPAELNQSPHRRFNPLLREWVLVSPLRTARPWQGKVENPEPRPAAYDPQCYLCPGNLRAGGVRNPDYKATFVFDNDYPALVADTAEARFQEEGLLVGESERGLCRVICFSPRHDLTISQMPPQDLRQVVEAWIEQSRSLGSLPWVSSVQIFENRGPLMGASNPHPHCQVWANAARPNVTAREDFSLNDYWENHKRCLLCDYGELEIRHAERVVCENEGFLALVPFWAVWPFETLVVSKRHLASIEELTEAERTGLAEILKRLTTRYDDLFAVSFPYSMGFHQAPPDRSAHPEWHFHAHYLPPLLRSATVQKFLVGYELLATPQRDITPEEAAERLRSPSQKG